jgi:hypothetical protein
VSTNWIAAGIGLMMLRDTILGTLAIIAIAELFVLFGWP